MHKEAVNTWEFIQLPSSSSLFIFYDLFLSKVRKTVILTASVIFFADLQSWYVYKNFLDINDFQWFISTMVNEGRFNGVQFICPVYLSLIMLIPHSVLPSPWWTSKTKMEIWTSQTGPEKRGCGSFGIFKNGNLWSSKKEKSDRIATLVSCIRIFVD